MVADVQGWVNASATQFGWLLKQVDEGTIGTAKRFDSRNIGNAANRPSLTVDYTATAGATMSIAATSAVKPEGNAGSTAFTFTVTRSGDTSGASSVNYAVTGSGASPANGGGLRQRRAAQRDGQFRRHPDQPGGDDQRQLATRRSNLTRGSL